MKKLQDKQADKPITWRANFRDAAGSRVSIDASIDAGRLSITGSVKEAGQYGGESGGQCYDSIIPANRYQAALVQLWKRWHLNDLRAGCVHQRRLKWTWADHPCDPCPVCGYKFGTSWLREELPPQIGKAIVCIIKGV